MNTKLFSGIFLLGAIFTTHAQDVIVSNDFGTDNATLNEQITGWASYDFDGDEDAWAYFNDANIQAVGFEGISAASASFLVDGTTLTPTASVNGYLSPLLDLTEYTASTLTFNIGAYLGAEAIMNYKVLVITEEQYADETLDIFSLTPLDEGAIDAVSIEEKTLDLSAYAGQSVYVLFMHIESDGLGYLVLDDIVVTASNTAGIKNTIAADFSVYPNPATNIINIANAGATVNAVQITDINGRIVKNATFESVSQAQVNIADLAAGAYMVTISSDKATTTKKFIKN